MSAPTAIVRSLADQMRRLESSFRPSEPVAIPLGVGGLNAVFPNGLNAGALIELLPRFPGAGAWTLALLLARYACSESKTLLIVDPERSFYPPAAQKFLSLERMILVRPKNARDALIALAEALRCSALGMVLGACERLPDRDSRRLQLAAETGGVIGVLVRPASALGTPSFARTRLLLEPLPSVRGRRRLKLEASARPQAALALEIDDATGHVRAFPFVELAAEHASSA